MSNADDRKAQFKSDINTGSGHTLCRVDIKFGDEVQAFLGFVCSFIVTVLIMCFYFKLHLQSKFPPKGAMEV